MFKGSIVALITPFKNNNLDEDCYISLIHHHLNNGTSGLVPAGTTGESPTSFIQVSIASFLINEFPRYD